MVQDCERGFVTAELATVQPVGWPLLRSSIETSWGHSASSILGAGRCCWQVHSNCIAFLPACCRRGTEYCV